MNFFNKLFPKRQSALLLNALGISRADRTQLSQATYFACLKVLSESMGKMPLKLQKKETDGGIRPALEHPLYDVLKYRPNNLMSSTGFFGTMEINRNHHGNSYAYISGAGSRTQLIPLDSKSVRILYDDAAWFAVEPTVWYKYTSSKGEELIFGSEEILHFRTSTSLDGISGLAVQDILRQNFESMHAADDLQRSQFTDGLTSRAVVTYTSGLSDDLRDKYIKILDDYATGKKKESKYLLPIPTGSTVTPLNAAKLADAQFVELKKYSALEIAAAMGIKPNQINNYDKSSYSSAEAQQLSFYVDTLLYIIKLYEDELNYKLLSDADRKAGYFFKFNFNVLLRADLATQTDSLCKAIQNSLYTPNEAREFVDKPALPGGDCLLCNGSMLPVQFAGVQYNAGKEGDES